MDDRVERLLDKAEKAINLNNTDQADSYAALASRVSYLRRKEARELERQFDTGGDTIIHVTVDPADADNPRIEVEDE